MDESKYQCCCCHIVTGLKFVAAAEMGAALLSVFALSAAWSEGWLPWGICMGILIICIVKVASPFILFAGIHYKSQTFVIVHCAGSVVVLLLALLLGSVYILVAGSSSSSTTAVVTPPSSMTPVKRVGGTMLFLVLLTLALMYELYLCVRLSKLIDYEEKLINRRYLSIRRQNRRVEKALERERSSQAMGSEHPSRTELVKGQHV